MCLYDTHTDTHACTHIHEKRIGTNSFIWLRDRGLFCSRTKKHHMHELTCITGRKTSLKKLAMVHTHPQNYAVVKQCCFLFCFHCEASKRRRHHGWFGLQQSGSSCSVLTETQVPFLRAAQSSMRILNVAGMLWL